MKTTKYLLLFIILIGPALTLSNVKFVAKYTARLTHVYAEDDERDGREEEDDDNKESDDYYQDVQTVGEPIVRYVTVVDPGFDRDTDGDLLVDALDPDPTIKQQEFFTDDDGDSVPNALDKHKGEDDLVYISFEDTNNNGILDSLE